MSTITKVALSFVRHLKPDRVKARASAPPRHLDAPQMRGGLPVMEAIARRRSSREFSPRELPPQVLSNLLWAAFGVNRPQERGRTAPTARDAQEIDVYVATAGGLFIYDAFANALHPVAAIDARKVTGYQDFVDAAPVDLVYVADHSHVLESPAEDRWTYSAVAAGAIAENVYLFCASEGLATVVRGWLDRKALGAALGLGEHERIIVAQTVGYPAQGDDARP